MARMISGSSEFQELAIDESKPMNIKSSIVVPELPVIRQTKMVSERIRHWPDLNGIPIKEVEGGILISIGCDTSEAR